MAHTRVKFTKGHEDADWDEDEAEEIKGWHLLAKDVGDGEYTACGLATPEYETKEEVKERGGITCKNCLETIRYYKGIKL